MKTETLRKPEEVTLKIVILSQVTIVLIYELFKNECRIHCLSRNDSLRAALNLYPQCKHSFSRRRYNFLALVNS
jgi:hypothetical protein